MPAASDPLTVSSLVVAAGLTVAPGADVRIGPLDLEVGAGERVHLRGPSGSGKTSILRGLCGLDAAVAGSVAWRGERVQGSDMPRFRRAVVYVAQRTAALPGSVRDNLARPFEYRSARPGGGAGGTTAARAFPEARARELLERLGIDAALFTRELRSLSEGEQQRVGLVRALLLDPDVLLLDEPTSALDADAAQAAEALVTETCERGSGAVIVTHDAAQAARWCTRTIDVPRRIAPPAERPHA